MGWFFCVPFPKISTSQKNSTNWSVLSARFCNSAPQILCNHQRRRIKALNMVHETNFNKATNKAMLNQITHCDSLGGGGKQAQWYFFIDTFLLGDQGQVFLFSHLISNLIYALYWNAHFKTIQGTQSGRFFYTIIETCPSTLAAPVDIPGRLQTNHMHCPQN